MPDFPIGPYVWSHPPLGEARTSRHPALCISFVDVSSPHVPAPCLVPQGDGAASINRTNGAGATNVRAWNSYEWGELADLH